MSTDKFHDPIEAYVTSYLLYLDGEGERPDLEQLVGRDREEAAARIRLLDAARRAEAEVPAGAMDRLARRFGFDRAGTRIMISGAKFKAARRQRNLDLKDVASAATSAGTPVRTSDLLKVESSKTTALDQELATVLVGVLDTTVAAIEDDHVQEMDVVRVFLASPFFDQLIAQWAAEHEPDADDVKQLVRDRVLAIHYRAQDVTEEQLADLVRVILRSLEP